MKKLLILLLLLHVTLFASIGTIAAMRGDVKIERNAQKIEAKIGTKIEKKDTILTQKKSKAQVIMMDETVITIGSESIYSFNDYGNDHAQMKIKKGFFRAITGKIGKIAPEKFKIKTRSATIGIRGTHFSGLIENGHEIIQCIRGKIIVDTAAKSYEVPQGMMITLSNHEWKMAPIAPTTKRSKANKKLQPNKKKNNLIKKQNINIQELEKIGTKLDTKIITPSDIPSYDPDK